MGEEPIWRYLTFAKYIDLLRTRSLFFPKAALFQDETEGKWFAHAHLSSQAQRWEQANRQADVLDSLLKRAGDDPNAILIHAALLHQSEESREGNLREVLAPLVRVYPHKRREYLESMITSWRKYYDDHNKEVETWASQAVIYRESTYISCWNKASSMSLAMWEMYGGGREAVAVRSTVSKLNAMLENNSSLLGENGLKGEVVDVRYIEGLKNPDERVHDQIYDIIEESSGVAVAVFRIKPSIYTFEQEVRAIIYPGRDIFAPLADPHPDKNGFFLQAGTDFIEAVYVHPTLGDDSMMVKAVREINNRFDVADVPIVADRIEALGQNIRLQPQKR